MATLPLQIDKLGALNYSNWQIDIKYLLMEKNAFDIVTGIEKEPEIDVDKGITAKDVKDFHTRKRLALSIIYLNIEKDFRKIIENKDDPKDVWDTLKKHFEPDNRSHHMFLFSEFMSCKIKLDEKIDLFAARLNRIADQLNDLGHPVKEVYKSFQLLRHLPSQFDSIVQVILRWEDKKFIFNDILLELIAEESRIALRDLDKSKELFVKTQHIQRNRLRCFRCGSRNHLQRDCGEYRKDFKKYNRRAPSVSSVSDASDGCSSAERVQSPVKKNRNSRRKKDTIPNCNNIKQKDVTEVVLNFNQSNIDLAGVKLGGECQNTKQCLVITANSTCSDGVCSCQSGYFAISEVNISFCETNAVDATDEDYSGSSSPPKARQQYVDPKMIIIMVVLAVMFVGICVALHLFSKARFRNHRTIFNSPHPRLMHIKLGKKKGRRRASHTSLEAPASRQLSICSQLSPLQSRRGSQAPSPEFSQKSRRANGDRKDASHAHRVHKTESAGKGVPLREKTDLTNGPGSPTVVVTSNKPNPPNTSSASARV